MTQPFPPTRAAGLARLQDFVADAGQTYTRRRNFDAPGTTARLSPWLRHRLISEHEVIAAVLRDHRSRDADKFIDEVFWRSYWKGWLEQRPGVWAGYRADRQAAVNRLHTETGLRDRWAAACVGDTGIACFDHWARELATDGYLHNHARMWFASIWIFTLRLPWVLGADLFLRLLIDGDAASNTLSWRWVAGLQTRGKHYLARAENIARFTEGRFNPVGQLNESAAPLEGADPPQSQPLMAPVPPDPALPTGILIHDEDLSLQHLPDTAGRPVAFLDSSAARGTGATAPLVRRFAEGALRDAATRLGRPDAPRFETGVQIADWAAREGLKQIVMPFAPAGPVADLLATLPAELRLVPVQSPWDSACWPHATHGFFAFRKQIPALIDRLIPPT